MDYRKQSLTLKDYTIHRVMKVTGSNVTVMVSDMDKAVQFYEQIGLILKQRWENHYATLTTEGITIDLHPTDSRDTHSGSVSIGFMIGDITEAKALLDRNKITYHLDEGKSGKYLHFKDPDGTILYFVEPA